MEKYYGHVCQNRHAIKILFENIKIKNLIFYYYIKVEKLVMVVQASQRSVYNAPYQRLAVINYDKGFMNLKTF